MVAALRGLGRPRRRPLGRLPPARPADLRALVRRARRARAARGRRLRAHRALPRRSSREAELVANPGCYPTATRARAGAARRAGPDRRRRRSTRSRASPAPAAAAATRSHFVTMTENAFPYKTEGHRHRPEIEQELRGARQSARRPGRPSSRTCCRSTRASWRAATSSSPSRPRRTRSRALYARALRGRAVRRGRRRPAGPARRPRHERVPRSTSTVEERRAGARLRGDRQPLEGRRRPGASRTST